MSIKKSAVVAANMDVLASPSQDSFYPFMPYGFPFMSYYPDASGTGGVGGVVYPPSYHQSMHQPLQAIPTTTGATMASSEETLSLYRYRDQLATELQNANLATAAKEQELRELQTSKDELIKQHNTVFSQ